MYAIRSYYAQLTGILQRRLPGGIDGIALRRTGQIHHRLGNGPLPLRWSHPLETIPCRQCDPHGIGIGVADILGGNGQQSAGHIQGIATCRHDTGVV